MWLNGIGNGASNQLQLNSISAMLQLTRELGEPGRRAGPVIKEALDLVSKVVAAQSQ